MKINQNETKLFRNSPAFWSQFVLILIAMAFLLSDWVVLNSSFGDFILAFGVIVLFLLGKVEITNKQFKIISLVIGVLLITIILSYSYNDYWISNKRILYSSIKLLFHLVCLIIFYNFIKDEKLEYSLLKTNNYLAIIAIITGVLITFLIYTNNFHIARFFWTFTRQDYRSYYYAGMGEIVRTRSIFSEPAHFGYYLNVLLFANLFVNKQKNIFMLSIIVLGVFVTLSYSMIFVLILFVLIYLIEKILKENFKLNKKYFILLLPLTGLVFYFWDFINITIIQRTINIISGADGSAYNRLFESWNFVEISRIIYGNGIGHTPPITNIFAYVLSDFGLVGFIPYITFTFFILTKNISLFVFFVTMNMSKGGYLNPAFWLFLLFIFIYGLSDSISPERYSGRNNINV